MLDLCRSCHIVVQRGQVLVPQLIMQFLRQLHIVNFCRSSHHCTKKEYVVYVKTFAPPLYRNKHQLIGVTFQKIQGLDGIEGLPVHPVHRRTAKASARDKH